MHAEREYLLRRIAILDNLLEHSGWTRPATTTSSRAIESLRADDVSA
jgi:hypothetical protein